MPTFNGSPVINPNLSSQILTDDIFMLYGGQTGTSTAAMRNVAYLIAEEQMMEYTNSFLLPTTVTGTYFWKSGNPINLEHGNIISVNRVTIESVDGSNGCEVDTVTGCHAVRGDGKWGYIDVSYLVNCGGCGSFVHPPYNVKVVYESGMQSGTTYQAPMLQALVLAAQINLNELDVSLSNEGTADGGIDFFINQGYHEKRLKGYNTAFGNSALSKRVALLARKYRTKPSIGFH